MVDASLDKCVIKLISGTYFLTIALFTVYAVWPVVAELLKSQL